MKKLVLAVVITFASVGVMAENVVKNSALGSISQTNSNNGNDIGDNNGSLTNVNSNNGTTVYGNSGSTTNVNNKSHKPQGYVNGVPLTASPGTCMGSIGGSVSGAAIGISGGKTYLDEECNNRANSTLVHNQLISKVTILKQMGLETTAIAMMCQNDEGFAAAFAATLSHEKFIALCSR